MTYPDFVIPERLDDIRRWEAAWAEMDDDLKRLRDNEIAALKKENVALRAEIERLRASL
jgi:hypothetical protein